MPFTWLTLPAAVGDKILQSTIMETRSKIDMDRYYVGISYPYSWSKAISIGTKLEAAEYTEMKLALDQAKDANTCSTHYSAHEATVRATHDAGYRSSHYTTYLSGNNTVVYSSHLDTDRSTHDTTYKATHKAVDQATNNATH